MCCSVVRWIWTSWHLLPYTRAEQVGRQTHSVKQKRKHAFFLIIQVMKVWQHLLMHSSHNVPALHFNQIDVLGHCSTLIINFFRNSVQHPVACPNSGQTLAVWQLMSSFMTLSWISKSLPPITVLKVGMSLAFTKCGVAHYCQISLLWSHLSKAHCFCSVQFSEKRVSSDSSSTHAVIVLSYSCSTVFNFNM